MRTRTQALMIVVFISAMSTVSMLKRADRAFKAPVDPKASLIAYFHENGIDLEKNPKLSNWWTVIKPAGGDFRVEVAILTFSLSASEQEMQRKLFQISLAFHLNPQAHIAMSYPSGRGTRPDSRIEDPADATTRKRLLELFDRYKGPEY